MFSDEQKIAAEAAQGLDPEATVRFHQLNPNFFLDPKVVNLGFDPTGLDITGWVVRFDDKPEDANVMIGLGGNPENSPFFKDQSWSFWPADVNICETHGIEFTTPSQLEGLRPDQQIQIGLVGMATSEEAADAVLLAFRGAEVTPGILDREGTLAILVNGPDNVTAEEINVHLDRIFSA